MAGSGRNYMTNWHEIRNKEFKTRPLIYQNGLVFKWSNNSHSWEYKHYRLIEQESIYIQKIDSSFNPPGSEASRRQQIYLKEKIHIPPYMVSKNLSVCQLLCVPPQKIVKWAYLDLI